MWKNIIIGSVVLFGASTYVYFANNTANVGEIACVQERFTKATNTCKEAWIDRTFKLYAEMRTEEFNQRREKFQQEKVELDTEDASVKESTAQAIATFEAAEADYKRMKEELKNLLLEAASAVGIEEEDDLSIKLVAEKIAELITNNGELERKIAEEENRIAALGAESDRLNKLITDGKKLNQDRQSRISPAELSCHVSDVSDNWNYVTLDAGVNKGIVIGSRLAVMRGDEKICELNVSTVEDKAAACDIVYSTLKVGETVQVGDRVEAVRNNK